MLCSRSIDPAFFTYMNEKRAQGYQVCIFITSAGLLTQENESNFSKVEKLHELQQKY